MVQIPGLKADQQLAHQYRREIAALLSRDNINFPGAQPVSFASKHIDVLRKEDYYVCEKSDGVRVLMYCSTGDGDSEIHYLIDRKNDFYYVEGLHFPMHDDPSFQRFHSNTLVDGELVLDENDDGSTSLRYLVFDCLVLDGQHLMRRTLDKRLGYFREHVFKPYEKLCKAFPNEVQFFPFVIEFKPMQMSYGIQMMFTDVIPNLKHKSDGLIFTARNSPYKFGTDDKILKWKPADENSIDFRLSLQFPIIEPDSDEEEPDSDGEPDLDYDAKPKFVLSANMGSNRYEKWAEMYMDDKEWEELKSMNVELDERIVECALDDQKRWRFKRFRDDKKDGNHISVIKSVMISIQDGVTKQDLLVAAPAVRAAWKKREADMRERSKQK